MDASTVVAICATAIAIGSLAVSVSETRATRQHYRLSVRPLLELDILLHPDRMSGLRLINAGLGPARITKTVLTVDGKELGEFNEANVNQVRDIIDPRPSAVTFGSDAFLAIDYDRFLLGIYPFDRNKHADFVDLVRYRLNLEIEYESLYPGNRYTAVWKPQTRPHPNPS